MDGYGKLYIRSHPILLLLNSVDVDDERRRTVGFLNGTASVTVHTGANGGVIAPCLRGGGLRHRRHGVVPVPVVRVTVV